jgi:hypothetical protein
MNKISLSHPPPTYPTWVPFLSHRRPVTEPITDHTLQSQLSLELGFQIPNHWFSLVNLVDDSSFWILSVVSRHNPHSSFFMQISKSIRPAAGQLKI